MCVAVAELVCCSAIQLALSKLLNKHQTGAKINIDSAANRDEVPTCGIIPEDAGGAFIFTGG